MKRTFFVLVLLVSAPSYAQDDIRVQQIDGKSFVCFTEDDAKVLLQLRLDYPKMKEKILILDERIELKNKMVMSLEDANEYLNQQNGLLLKTNAGLEEKLDSMDSWYRSPILWSVVGVVIGVGITVGVMYAVK
ncbi:MAG: hypothetical protein WC444_04430 [Candidatus Paceibacterota bacterium]